MSLKMDALKKYVKHRLKGFSERDTVQKMQSEMKLVELFDQVNVHRGMTAMETVLSPEVDETDAWD